MSKKIQSGRFLGNTLANLGKKALSELSVPFAKDVLPKLATKATLFILDEFERKEKWDRGHKSRKMIHFIHFK